MYIKWDFSGFDKKCLNIFNWKINVFSKIAQMAVYFFFFYCPSRGVGWWVRDPIGKFQYFFFKPSLNECQLHSFLCSSPSSTLCSGLLLADINETLYQDQSPSVTSQYFSLESHRSSLLIYDILHPCLHKWIVILGFKKSSAPFPK